METPANEFVGKELIALAINLCMNSNNAELMLADGDGLKLLLHRAKKTWDPLLAKLIRTISMHHGKCKEVFLVFLANKLNLSELCARYYEYDEKMQE